MYDFMLDGSSRAARDELRELVKTKVDPEDLRRMDRDEIGWLRELYEASARRNTLGLRLPTKYGWRALPWVAEGADFCLAYVRTTPDEQAPPEGRISAMLVDRGPGVEVEYPYGLMGSPGGRTGGAVFRDVEVSRET